MPMPRVARNNINPDAGVEFGGLFGTSADGTTEIAGIPLTIPVVLALAAVAYFVFWKKLGKR